MTHDTKRARRTAPLPVAMFAALLLAGCSSGHVGESWQCPLAEGGTCDSVAAADPAVPDPDAARNAVLKEPLWRVRATAAETPPEPGCAATCGAGFDPFGWLARLFGGADGADDDDGAGSDTTAAAPAGSPEERRSASGSAVRDADAATSMQFPGKQKSRSENPAGALPADPDPEQDDPVAGDLAEDDLRTDEIVARIWIAPFVDAEGVYREASHVRVVLEPAGWRLR